MQVSSGTWWRTQFCKLKQRRSLDWANPFSGDVLTWNMMRPARAHDGVGVGPLETSQGVFGLVDQVVCARHRRLGVVSLLVVSVVLIE